MTTPQQSPDGTNAQILLKLGEMGSQLAVVIEQLKAIPDHESRIRALERFRYTLAGLAIVGGTIAGAVGYWVGHVLH